MHIIGTREIDDLFDFLESSRKTQFVQPAFFENKTLIRQCIFDGTILCVYHDNIELESIDSLFVFSIPQNNIEYTTSLVLSFSTDVDNFIKAMLFVQDICNDVGKFKVELNGNDISKFENTLISSGFRREAVIPSKETVVIYGRIL